MKWGQGLYFKTFQFFLTIIFIFPLVTYADINHWRELNSSIRELLSDHLGPISRGFKNVNEDKEFQQFYHRYFCSTSHDHKPEHCLLSGSVSADSVYPEFVYNSLTLASRVASACLLWKISEQFSGRIPDELGDIMSAAQQAYIDVELKNSASLVSELKKRGYTRNFEADRGKIWGLRDPRQGAQLHWYQDGPHSELGTVNIHIDFLNPGAGSGSKPWQKAKDCYLGIEHTANDLQLWNLRTLTQMVASLGQSACGLGTSDLGSVAQSNLSIPIQMAEKSTNLILSIFSYLQSVSIPF